MATQYTAQQKVDLHQAAVTLALGLMEAIKNPEGVHAAAKELIDANSLSAERRAEADKAEHTIATAAIVSSDIELKKEALANRQKDFDIYIKDQTAKLDEKIKYLQVSMDDFNAAKVKHEQVVINHDNNKNNFDKFVVKQNEFLDGRDKALKVREEQHERNVKALNYRESKIVIQENQVKEELDKIAAKKQKLLDVAKED